MKRKITLEGRLALSSGRASSALSLFEQAAVELEQAAEEARAVETEASAKVSYYGHLSTEAHGNAITAKVRATKIRELFQ